MHRRNKFISFKVGILLTVGLMAIFTGGYYAYNNLTHAINILSTHEAPHQGLNTINKLTVALEQAENNMRLYGITNQKEHINKYNQLLSQIDTLLLTLGTDYPENIWYNNALDSINLLVKEKTQLWQEMIDIWQTGTRPSDLSGISDDLQQIEPKSQKFISRFFGLAKKETESNSQNIISQLNKLEKDEMAFEKKLSNKENELAASNEKLNQLFDSFIAKQKIFEQEEEQQRIKNAQDLSDQAYRLLTWFTIIGVIVAVVLLFILVKYIRKNRAYNRILEKSRYETERLAKVKEQFMANVSHEIRTPLNAISGFVKQLLNSENNRADHDKLNIINEASDQLIHLINDVLDLTKLQSGNLPLYKVHFSPNEIVSKVCVLFNEMADKNGNHIVQNVENPENLVLYGDANKFQQILYNLISNANKFTKNGTIRVNVDISGTASSQVKLTLEIKDTGLGIEQSKINEVFKEYTQENNDTSIQFGGTGLGLSIVKKLVTLFDGNIEIKSRKGEGTTVRSILMFDLGNKSEVKKVIDENIEVIFPKNTKVLIADDEVYNSMLIKSTLEKWGLDFDVAKNGLEAIELLKEHRYSYVLMDLRMPVVNGQMATKFIRETLQLSKDEVCVIGVTADIHAKQIDKLKSDFNAILIKPFSDKALYEAMNLKSPSQIPEQNKFTTEKIKAGEEGNLSNLLRVAGNDMPFIQEMLEQFEQSTLQGLKDIELEIEAGSMENTAELAHKLAPACRHLEAKQLLMHLKQIEVYALEKNKTEILKILPTLHALTIQTTNNLKQQLKELIS